MSPVGLAQGQLVGPGRVWGRVTDGLELRLARQAPVYKVDSQRRHGKDRRDGDQSCLSSAMRLSARHYEAGRD